MSPPPYLHPSAGQPSLADLRSIVPLPFPPTPRHVSFPVQTLAKTAKTVPVMLWGATMLRKRYTPSEYALAALVTSGCTLFLVSGESAATVEVSTGASSGGGSAAWGGALMAVYLGFDGFTSTFQERLYRGRLYRGGQEMTPHHQVLFVTAFSCALALVSLATSGALGPALSFVLDHPACLWDMLLISSTATLFPNVHRRHALQPFPRRFAHCDFAAFSFFFSLRRGVPRQVVSDRLHARQQFYVKPVFVHCTGRSPRNEDGLRLGHDELT